MPIKEAFAERLYPVLSDVAQEFKTPFHIYDEVGIIENGEKLKEAFAFLPGFREYFAVKACPNLEILKIMKDLGFGFDCSSIPELKMCRDIGARGEDIMFTSNNTSADEFYEAAADWGCILNLDDITLIDKVPTFPELICFRYNPGSSRSGNNIIGNPEDAKYGMSEEQIMTAFNMAICEGAERYGLHTMVCSNQLDCEYLIETVRMILDLAGKVLLKFCVQLEFVNIGGGIGIPYHPEQNEFDLITFASETKKLFKKFENEFGYVPKLFMECGRYITGPYGVLVTTVINRMSKHREYVGVDACMSALMRPALYDAYHHIDVLGAENRDSELVDVVGSLCENNDKFAKERELPICHENDLLIIQDTGAHGHAMGFQYNGRLRPQELLLEKSGSVKLIRRAETVQDYFQTQIFQTQRFVPSRK